MLLFVFCILASLLGFLVGHRVDWIINAGLRQKLQRLKGLEADLKYFQDQLQIAQERSERYRSERDDYAKIASTHDIKLPQPSNGCVLWYDYAYCNTMDKLLENLRDDIRTAAGSDEKQFFIIEIEIGYQTSWSYVWILKYPNLKHSALEGVRLKLKFMGSAEKISEEIMSTFKDPHEGFNSGFVDEKPVWQCNGVLKLSTTLSMTASTIHVPTQVVEVLRIQEVPVDVVHERVVYHYLDGKDDATPNVDVLDASGLKAHIEIAVEEAMARRLGLPGPQKQLSAGGE